MKKVNRALFVGLIVVWIITTTFLGLEVLGVHIAGYALHFTPEELSAIFLTTIVGLLTITHYAAH